MTVFKKYKVQPEGRNKYGGYYSKENVRSNLTYSVYNGNLSTETISEGNKPNTGATSNNTYILFLLSTQGNFEGSDIAISAQTSTSRLVSYCNSNPVVSFIGNIGDSADTHNGITGYAESGMTISIINNGTTATTLQVTVDSSLNRSQGTLIVPCYVPKNGEVGMEDSWSAWKELADSNSLFCQELEWNWDVSSEATSQFILDLTNETASVNCDVNGNVLSGVVLPDCWARLYYGEEMLESATYSIYIAPGYNANGVNFNTNTGYLYFSNNLSFDGKVLIIEITGTYAGTSRTANFTLNKNIPGEEGQPGQDAVAKWLETTTEEIVFDPNTSAFTPNSVSCRVLKQVGSGTPEEITSAETVWYKFNDDLGWSSGTSVTINVGLPLKKYIIFALATSSFTIYEQETVHILCNGEKGDQGVSGATGPTIRGPIDWYSGITQNRRFCNGRGPLEVDYQFIDIIIKDGIYYRCITSYDATPNDSWSNVESNWEAAGNDYAFVAAEVLLAENAKINFLTNNAIKLMDSSGNTSGGAQGGSGNTIAFWAGSSSPSSAPFRVSHNGDFYAKSGTFAGYIQMPYVSVRELQSSSTSTAEFYSADTRAYIVDPGGLAPNLTDGRTIYLPQPNSDLNGFTYYILCRGWQIGTYTQSETYNTYLKIIGNQEKFISCVNGYATEGKWSKIGLYAGINEVTCAFIDNDWCWVLVSANTGAYLLRESYGQYKWFKTKYDEELGTIN